MRALSSAQEAKLFSTSRITLTKVQIQDETDAWVDYTVAGGSSVDWVDEIRISATVEQPVVSATIRLHREVDGTSLAPYLAVGHEKIKAGRGIRIYAAVGDIGDTLTSGDYWFLFDGFIDGWSTGGRDGKIVVEARDRAGLLADTWTIAQNTYGSEAGVAIATVMAQILQERLTDSFTTIGDPDFGVITYTQQRQSILDAIKALADLIGWLFRYRWSDSAGAFEFQFFEPDRSAATPVFTVTPSDYYDIPLFGESSDDIRNEGIIEWSGGTVTATDATSIAEYGRTKTIVLDASNDIQITTEARATNFITAVVSDLSQPLASQSAVLPLFPPVQVNDYYRFNANAALYSDVQDQAVVAYEHYIGPNGTQTTLQLRGQPTGGVTRWNAVRNRLERTTTTDTTPAELTADDIEFYYTTTSGSGGFTTAGTAAGSLGGYVSTTAVSSAVNGLFRAVSETERVATITLYRAVGVVNNGSTASAYDWESVIAYLTDASGDGITWAIGFDPQGVHTKTDLYGVVIADEETAPSGVTFQTPSSFTDSPQVGGDTIPGGSGRIIWIRLEVASGATAKITNDALILSDQVPSS